ncbi:MAG: translocation/assembly module TamB domain-containing protein [Alphaproteobacteria bacterium]|nr:translocation/assembly module TamB domain-containing protein [Alphaproteobacteria bacterium]
MRRWRLGCLAAAGLLGVLVCAGGVGIAWLAGPAGNAFLRAELERRASAAIPGSVRIGGLETRLDGTAELVDVALLDPAGNAVLTARRVEVAWGRPSPIDLVVTGLDGRVTVGRDGSIDLVEALGTDLPTLPDVELASVAVSGRLDVDVGGFAAAVEDLELRGSGDTAPMGAALSSARARVVTAFGERAVDGTATLGWEDRLDLGFTGTLGGEALELDLHATDPFGTGGIDGRLQGSGALPAPFAGELAATATVTGTWDALVWHADLERAVAGGVDGTLALDTPDWPFTAAGDVRFADAWDALPADTAVSGRVSARGSLAPQGRVDGDFAGSVRAAGIEFPASSLGFSAGVDGVALDPVALGGPHAATGSARFGWQALDAADLALDLDLGRLASVGLPPGLEGRLVVDLDVAGTEARGATRVRDVAWRGFAIPAASGPLRGTLRDWALSARVPLDVPVVEGRGARVEGARIPLDVRWAPGEALRAEGSGTAATADVLGLAVLRDPRARVSVTARPGQALRAEGRVEADAASLTTVPLTDLHATGALRGDAATGTISGQSPWGAVSVGVRGDLAADSLVLADAVVTPSVGPEWRQAGEGSARLVPGGLADLRLALAGCEGCEAVLEGDLGGDAGLDITAAVPVAPYAALLGVGVDGRAGVRGRLTLPRGEPAFAGELAVSSLRYGDASAGDFAGQAWLRADRAGLSGVWAAREGLDVGVDAELGIDPSRGIDLDAPWSARVTADAMVAGELAVRGTPRAPEIDGRGLLRWEDAVLGQVRVSGSGERVVVDGRLWDGHASFGASVDPGWAALLAGAPVPPQGEAHATADLPWSAVLDALGVEADVEGVLTGSATAAIDGWMVRPAAQWRTEGRVGTHAVQGDGTLGDGVATGQIAVGDGRIAVSGHHAPLDVRTRPDGLLEIDGRDVPLGLVTAFVPDLEDGQGALDLSLAVDRDGPRGSVRVDEGAVRHRFLGVALEQVTLRAAVEGREITAYVAADTWPARVRGRKPGRLVASAHGAVQGADLVLSEAAVELERAHVVSRPLQKARISAEGPLAISGSARHPVVRGALRVDEAELEVDRKILIEADLWAAAPRELDPRITLVRDGIEVPRAPRDDRPFWSFVDADVLLDLGPLAEGSMALPYLDGLGALVAEASRVRMEGRVVGKLRVKAADGRASAEGVVDVTDASARVGSSRFVLDRGQVQFVDGDLFRPYVQASGSLGLGGGVSVQMGLRGEPQGATLALTSAQLDGEGEVWTAVISGQNPRLVRSSVGLASELALGVVSRTMFDRADLGRWELAGGGLQTRFRPLPALSVVGRVAPFNQTRDALALGAEYAPDPRIRLEGWVGNVDRWVGVGWRHRY